MENRADKKYVKVMGRSLYKNEIRYLGNSASYIEFVFTGTSALAQIVVINEMQEIEMRTCIAVIINDGSRGMQRIALESGEREILLFESEKTETVKIRIQKLSESKYGIVGVKLILADGVITPTPDLERRIEFIGDSITCGYGVEGTLEGEFTTWEENPLKAYAVLCASCLQADYQLIARSGIGIISNWIEPERQTPDTIDRMPVLYEYTDLHGQRILEQRAGLGKKTGERKPMEKDGADFCPHLVVIHIGNNDASYTRNNIKRKMEFEKEYADFIKKVQKHNPDAAILCVLGLFGAELCDSVKQCVKEAEGEVYFLQLEQQKKEDGLGTGEHPGPLVQEKTALKLTEKIRQIMKW